MAYKAHSDSVLAKLRRRLQSGLTARKGKVRFWGPTQPESRQYFWKESAGFYDYSYDDPRKSKPPRYDVKRALAAMQKKKSKGQKR